MIKVGSQKENATTAVAKTRTKQSTTSKAAGVFYAPSFEDVMDRISGSQSQSQFLLRAEYFNSFVAITSLLKSM